MVRVLVGVALPTIALACSCASGGPPCQAAWNASVVFVGTVVELSHDTTQPDSRGNVRINGFLGTHAIFEVAEGFIGIQGPRKQVEVRTGMGGGDCGYTFQRGEKYVVYARENTDGTLVTSICSRTARQDRAQADLDYLRQLPKAGTLGYVYGIAADGNAPARFDPALGVWQQSGIGGAAVTLTGPGRQAPLVTGDDGEFRFDGLPPGEYRVSVAKDGYTLQYGSPPLDVHAGGCGYAWERLVVDHRIAGKVAGANGLPAANIQVELVPRRPTQQNQLPFPVAETRTAADGSYELRNLRPGEYYLGINLAHTASADMPYTRYFYPGAEDPAQAALVMVGENAGTVIHDFPIPAPLKQQRVEGFVYGPDLRPVEKVQIMIEDIRWPWQTSVVAAITDATGHFEIRVFEGTAYRIHAVTMAQFTNQSLSAEPFPLGPGADLSEPLRLVLTRKGHSAAELTGKGLERWRAGLGP
jgi:hypothetical protein